MYFFVFRLRAVRPAAGNRTARNWQPHGPQLENGVLVDAQRVFIQCIVTYAEAYRYFASAFGELMPLVSLLPTGI
jgi:hypothetical protein